MAANAHRHVQPGVHTAQHSHDFLGSRHDVNARATRWVVLLTAVMMVGEILAGVATGSMALLADGIHMATHAGALGVAAIAYSYARRHRDDSRFSFGTGKVGDLAGFASALVLGIFAIGIAVESASRFFQPITVAFGDAAIVAVVGLLVNIASAFLLSGDHHHHGHEHHDHHHGQDNNLRSAYMHVLADALTSVLAILALVAGFYFGIRWLDPVMGLVGAVVIARWSWTLMRDTAAILLDSSSEALVAQVRDAAESSGGVDLDDIHIWRVGPEAHAVILSFRGGDETSQGNIRERISSIASLKHVTIEAR